MGFVHNDLKPENLVAGLDDPNRVYLIDFGLASLWRDVDSNCHVSKKQLFVFQGNFKFATKNQCGGLRTSRRDDIQSTFFILLFLLNVVKLPWMDQGGAELLITNRIEWLA